MGRHTMQKFIGVLELDVVSALSAQISTLTNQANQMPLVISKQQAQPVPQVQIFCEICGEGHMSNLSLANLESVYFVGNANRGQANKYGNTYNPNWRNHPNFFWGGNQGAQNQYRPQAPQQQYRLPQAKQNANLTTHLEEMMKKFMADQSAQTTEMMKKVMADQQAQAAAMRKLERQMGQLAMLEEVPKKKKYTTSLEGELVPKPVEENEKENKGSEPEVPKYARYLRDIVSNKRRHTEFETVALTEECSARVQSKLPPKLRILGVSQFLCLLENMKLLADRSLVMPKGIIEDVLVRVEKFILPADFIVPDYKA
nr:uncharacterized protein LOC104107376 [Nicotiana tomentosiformis]